MQGLQLSRKAGSTRCPYCHDPCEACEDVAVCSHCLSRHHQACWEEAAHCSSCRAEERIAFQPQPEPDRWRLELPDLIFAEVCFALASCLLLATARSLVPTYESMGVILPWVTKTLLRHGPHFVWLVLSPIPIGAALDRKANLRGAGWGSRTIAVVAIFCAAYALCLPLLHVHRCLCQ